MTERFVHRRNRGFSLVETLAVVAILVILLGVSAVGAAYYRDYLKITELDNAAREIYMAAENRAVLLGGGGQLDKALEGEGAATLAEGGGEASSVYVDESKALSLGLLSGGAVDPALLDEKFYIVYDRASGAVTDVFYAEGGQIQGIERAFQLAEQGRDARMRPGGGEPMLGYYGGQQQARDPFAPLPAPEVMVEIENAERLTVKVTFTIPEEARKLMGGYNETALSGNTRRLVELNYPGMDPVTIFDSQDPLASASFRSRLVSTAGTLSSGKISYTWVLDELDTNAARDNGRHFREIFNKPGASYGEDFTVSAEITISADGRRPVSASGQDTDNSLFAARSGGDTARLENVRHLQNLDQETSQTGNKTAALQLVDIDCYHTTPYPEYEFVPIANKDLLSFDGGWSVGEDGTRRRNEILDLHVTEKSARGKKGAGLFSRTNDGTPAKPVTFTGIRLIDAEVSAPKTSGALAGVAGNNSLFKDVQVLNAAVDGRTASGGVVGSIGYASDSHSDTTVFENIRVVNTQVNCDDAAGGVAGRVLGTVQAGDFKNCWVYWEAEEQQDVRDLMLGNGYIYDGDDSGAYKITGASAGGLVGELRRAGDPSISTLIQNCLAATTVRGTASAGGFIGHSDSNTSIQDSYTDCYLSGPAAAGLVGQMLNGNSLWVENAYTAGFVDMKETVKAAGFCLGNAKVTAENSYAAVYYPGKTEGKDYTGSIFQLTEKQEASNIDEFTKTYYLNISYGHKDPQSSLGGSPEKQAKLVSYSELSSAAAFISSHGWGGSFAQKTIGASNPYNLQESMRLDAYEFPGLKNLPHYGDWYAEFSKPSLVYYEDYGKDHNGEDRIGFSGGNARYMTDEDFKIGSLDKLTIRSDGYAVAFLADDLPNAACTITYTYLDNSDPKNPQWKWKTSTRSYDKNDKNDENRLRPTTWDGKDYYLAPLPKDLVIGGLTSQDFFQYLHFEATGTGTGLTPSGESFYNPHFAEAVIPYASEDGSPFLQRSESAADAVKAVSDYVSVELIANRTKGAVSIRTPRHFFDLSRYPDYYHNTKHRLIFQQELDLDGKDGVYTGYPGLLEYSGGVQLQSRIGTERAPFLGVYEGNCRTIRRLAFTADREKDPSLEEDTSLVAVGLFGHSNGTLRNIVYKLDETPKVDTYFPNNEKDACVGALAGRNGSTGTVENCAVEAVRMDLRAYTSTLYTGGLVGLNEGRILRSAADCALIRAEASHYAHIYAGGLVGLNRGGLEISESYAVGRLSAVADKDTAPALASGFAGWNSGSISRCYSAMDLQSDGAGAKSFGFCGRSDGGRQSNTFFLNKGNFSYREEEFSANYDAGENSTARSVTYRELTGSPSIVPGMTMLNQEGRFPYPAAVKNGAAAEHYGEWPKPLDLGKMGVYYWEEHVTEKGPEYNYTILAVKPEQTTVSRISLLQRHRDQGCVVRSYGYGYYNVAGKEINSLTSTNLLYSIGGGDGQSFQTLFNEKKLAGQQVQAVDTDLATKIKDSSGPNAPAFVCHSFRSFGLDASQGGLYPDSAPRTANAPAVPNATLSLSQSGNLWVEFTLNPFFAEALSVTRPNENWTLEEGVPSEAPGSAANPYGVRTIEQLELINWNRTFRDTTRVIPANAPNENSTSENIAQFPYLSYSSGAGEYFWKQSHDIHGEKDKTYTPIAEYYDTTNQSQGNLYGWFGGDYDGDGYKIENVNITGHANSSCSGLFGIVYDGSLRNVVLYSSDGKGVITTDAGKEQTSQSCWFAIGGLAGVAGTRNLANNAIVNCSVAGYKIQAEGYTAAGWGGNMIGGLVGASHMNLSGCSAVADIVIQDAKENDNMRVGGLAGSCQGNVTNCYAGGSISFGKHVTLTASDKGIYIGGLVGGTYMKPLQIGGDNTKTIGFVDDPGWKTNANPSTTHGWVNNVLTNCYSYVTLPPVSTDSSKINSKIKGLFVLGGAGEINPPGVKGSDNRYLNNSGTSIQKNCYYLNSAVDEEAILDSGVITDLRHTGYVAGSSYRVGQQYRVRATEQEYPFTRVSGSIEADLGGTYYCIPGSVEEEGLLLFQYTGGWPPWYGNVQDRDYGYLYDFTFRGWLKQGANGTWTLSTNSDDFIGLTGLSYEQLSGTADVTPGQTIYKLLPAFSKVDNSSGDGVVVPGKYSYPPATRSDLQDRDYPFPTVLKKDAGEGLDPYHVHYGGWPLNGFRRQRIEPGPDGKPVYLGGSPISIDLFSGKTYQEYLVLTENVNTGGTWSVRLANQSAGAGGAGPIVQVAKGGEPVSGTPKTYLLELTALRSGSGDLIVSYTVGGAAYSLSIPIHVTSGVKLRPDRLFMFPDDTAEIKVKAVDRNGVLLTEGLLELKGHPNCGGSAFLTAETVTAKQTADAFPSVRFSTAAAPAGEPLMSNTDFDYVIPAGGAQAEQRYGGSGDIRVDVIQPWEVSFPEPGIGADGTPGPRTCVITFPASFSVVENGEETDLLEFSGLQAAIISSPAAVTKTEETRADGTVVYTLTYGQDVTAIPETRLSISLTMTSRDHTLIPETEAQTHQLTLTVVEAASPAPPEGQSLSAVPADASADASADAPADASAGAPAGAPADAPAVAPADASAGAPAAEEAVGPQPQHGQAPQS